MSSQDLTGGEISSLQEPVTADPIGLGPLEALLEDDSVEEIIVDRFDHIAVERDGVVVETPHRFSSERQLRRLIERIAVRSGRRLDASSRTLEVRLFDGRASAVIPPISVGGSALVIRTAPRRAWTPQELVETGTLTREICTVLDAAMRGRLNVIVSGAPGSGKTTLINALAAFIPAERRIITIEDVAELQLQHPNVMRLEAGAVAGSDRTSGPKMRDLVDSSLRLHPGHIVFGDIRGAESIDVLLSMRSGGGGVLASIHADSPEAALDRLETFATLGDTGLPSRLVRRHIGAVDLIVQLERSADGSRRATSVMNVVSTGTEGIELHDVLNDGHGSDAGTPGPNDPERTPQPRADLLRRLAAAGIELPWSIVRSRSRNRRRA